MKLTWQHKLKVLMTMAANLCEIHEAGFIHIDLHPGNILCCEPFFKIDDFGLARRSEDCSNSNDRIYGVIPYIAPEILKGHPYTPAADIYSFSMLMWEFASGKPPFVEETYDQLLALQIIDGKRPIIVEEVPSCYAELMKQCWNVDPNERPSSYELFVAILSWYNSESVEDKKQFETAEAIRKEKVKSYDPNKFATTNTNTVFHGQRYSTKAISDSRTGILCLVILSNLI